MDADKVMGTPGDSTTPPFTAIQNPLTKVLDRLRQKMTEDAPVAPEPAWTRQAAEKALAKLAAVLGPKYGPEKASLARYQEYDKRQREVLRRMQSVLEQLNECIDVGRNIVWYGSVGTGKDHLMASLLYAAAALGHDCHWVNVQRLNATARDRMSQDAPEERLIRDLAAPKVLGLSDPIPPAGQPTAWNINLLYRVLDERARLERGTWVTANANSEKEMQDALSVPVWSRLREDAEVLPCFWPDYRGRKK